MPVQWRMASPGVLDYWCTWMRYIYLLIYCIYINLYCIYSDFSTAQECTWKACTELGSLKVWQVIAPFSNKLPVVVNLNVRGTSDDMQSEFPTGSQSYLLCSVAQQKHQNLLFWFPNFVGKKERVPKHHRFPLNISMVQSIRRPKVWKEESRQYRGGWTLGAMTFRADETLIVLKRWW